MKAIIAPVWMLLVLAGVSSCNLGNSSNADGAIGGKANCLAIRDCVRANCSGASPDQTCVQSCLNMGTAVAQTQYRNLTSCLVNICCTDTAGCGGGDPRCSATGTPACESCTCQAQCNVMNAPCRAAATACYGLQPDCSTCM